MKFFRNINTYFRDARKSVMRNFSLSLASISCITITLIVVAFSAILSYNVENFAESIRKDVTVVIFLNSDTTETKRNEIEKEIRATKNVEELTFVSKEKTAESLKDNDTFKGIIETWTDKTNPLLDSFMLKVKNIDDWTLEITYLDNNSKEEKTFNTILIL